MPKRIPLDSKQFNVRLPKPKHEPLDAVIPTSPPPQPLQQPQEPQMPEPVKDQINEQANVQTSKRSFIQNPREIVRGSYDIYRDQALKITKLQVERQQEEGKNVTKGEVMRDLLDEYFKNHKDVWTNVQKFKRAFNQLNDAKNRRNKTI